MGSSDSTNITYPEGTVLIDPDRREICGNNPERQDFIIEAVSAPATKWSGYFCARFDHPFASWGIAHDRILSIGETRGNGATLSGYAVFNPKLRQVNVKVGVSFLSIQQARENLDIEIPDGQSLEETARSTRSAWAEKLDRVSIKGATRDQAEVFYTAFFHALQVRLSALSSIRLRRLCQYPYEQDEYGRYYSGYDNAIHQGVSYNGYSNWVCAPLAAR